MENIGISRWKSFLPIIVTLLIALFPAPHGLEQYAWYFFAIFAGMIAALVMESFTFVAVGLMGATVITVFAPGYSLAQKSWQIQNLKHHLKQLNGC